MSERVKPVRIKVLAVDDHPLIREALRHVLQDLGEGVEVFEAEDEVQAFAALERAGDVGLILLDLALPGTTGLETLRRLRRKQPGARIVVLSATADAVTALRAADEGAVGFIPKNCAPPDMLAALKRVLGGGEYFPPGMRRRKDSETQERPQFTQRQSDVLRLLVKGKSNKAIASELNLAERTVKLHVTAIFRVLKVSSRTQAVIAATGLDLKP